jgi:hypothetical protein
MRRLICTLLMSGILSAGLFIFPSANTTPENAKITIAEVLRAHNVPQTPQALRNWFAEAVKLTLYPDEFNSDFSTFFERKMSVARSGAAFRRSKIDPMALREQVEIFDGQNAFARVSENGKRVEENSSLADPKLEAVKFSVQTFGLVPVLRELLEPETKILYLERTQRKQEKFQVETSTGNFILYCDQWHRIRSIEIGDKIIEYADYRSVGGVQLPFIQRFSVGNRLLYELIFTRIDIAPLFSASYFNRENL